MSAEQGVRVHEKQENIKDDSNANSPPYTSAAPEMNDTITGAYIGVGSVILGVIIAGPITYYYAKKLVKQTHGNAIEALRISEFNKASACFYEAFHKTLMELDNGNLSVDTDAIIKRDIEKQISAVHRFKFHLPQDGRVRFLDTWEAYEKECRKAKYADLAPVDRDKRGKLRRLALYRIYQVLKFAGYEKSEYPHPPKQDKEQ